MYQAGFIIMIKSVYLIFDALLIFIELLVLIL